MIYLKSHSILENLYLNRWNENVRKNAPEMAWGVVELRIYKYASQ